MKGMSRPSCAMSDAMVRSTRLRDSSLKALPNLPEAELQQEVQDGAQGRPCAQHAKRSMSACCWPRNTLVSCSRCSRRLYRKRASALRYLTGPWSGFDR